MEKDPDSPLPGKKLRGRVTLVDAIIRPPRFEPQHAFHSLVCFPVVDGALFGPDYPQPDAETLASRADVGGDDIAVLVVVAASPSKKLIANMLAPIVIDVVSRNGAQVALDHRTFSAAYPIETRRRRPATPTSRTRLSQLHCQASQGA